MIESQNIGSRVHVLVCQKATEQSAAYILANVYAPCPNSQPKITFFEQLFEVISELSEKHMCNRIIVGGDFNLNFDSKEVKILFSVQLEMYSQYS